MTAPATPAAPVTPKVDTSAITGNPALATIEAAFKTAETEAIALFPTANLAPLFTALNAGVAEVAALVNPTVVSTLVGDVETVVGDVKNVVGQGLANLKSHLPGQSATPAAASPAQPAASAAPVQPANPAPAAQPASEPAKK